MRALQTLRASWLSSVTVLVIGTLVLVNSLPDLSDSTASAEWRPEGARISGRWEPSRPVAVFSFESDSDPGFVELGDGGRSNPIVTPPPRPRGEGKTEREAGGDPARTGIQKYRVEDGDRYWTIAERFLGRGHRWPEIQALNPDVPPHRLREGTIIRVPIVSGTVVKNGARNAITRSGNHSPANPRPLRPLEHRVRRGESLSEIASRYYIDGDWRRIFDANRDRVKHPNRVEKGTMLIIPPAPGKERRS